MKPVIAGIRARTTRGRKTLVVDVLRPRGHNTYDVRAVETGKRFIRHRDFLVPLVSDDPIAKHGFPNMIGKPRPWPPRDSEGPTLVWEKQSFKRYTAQGLGGAVLEIVKSGTKTSFNETWHPIVFGNRFAYAKSFESWTEAAMAAERLAIEYVNRVLHALAGMPIAQRFAKLDLGRR